MSSPHVSGSVHCGQDLCSMESGCGPGSTVQGLGSRVQGLGFRVFGLGARVEGLGSRV